MDRLQIGRGWIAAGVMALSLAVMAPSALAAQNTTSGTSTTSTGAAVQPAALVQKVATDLGLTVQEVQQALRTGGVQGLANAAHLTVPRLRQTLRQDGVLGRVRARVVAVRLVRGGALVGLRAIAQSLGMKPRDLLAQARRHQLQLPSGMTAQTLETTGDAAAVNWLKGLASKHPKLTSSAQARLEKAINKRIARLVTHLTQG